MELTMQLEQETMVELTMQLEQETVVEQEQCRAYQNVTDTGPVRYRCIQPVSGIANQAIRDLPMLDGDGNQGFHDINMPHSLSTIHFMGRHRFKIETTSVNETFKTRAICLAEEFNRRFISLIKTVNDSFDN